MIYIIGDKSSFCEMDWFKAIQNFGRQHEIEERRAMDCYITMQKLHQRIKQHSLARQHEMEEGRAPGGLHKIETLRAFAKQHEIEEGRALARQHEIDGLRLLFPLYRGEPTLHERIKQHSLARQHEMEEGRAPGGLHKIETLRAFAKQHEIEEGRALARQHEIDELRSLFPLYRGEPTFARQHEIEEGRAFARQHEIEEGRALARLHEIIKRRAFGRQHEIEERRALFPFNRGEPTPAGLHKIETLRAAILNADTIEEKMFFGKQEVHFSNRRSCHGTNLLKSSLSFAHLFLPLAGGTGHGSSLPEHQGHSEIYPSTLNAVSNCPSLGEYMQRSLAKCADVCGNYMQDGNCAYHCMRDSSKTKLVEFCAKPKPLFDFCPEYDPVDQTIQKDMATLCNSTFSRNYYNSSDIYFCDPNNCLQLHESSMRSGATTLTTLMNGTTEMNGGDSQESFLWLFVSLAAITFAVIIIGYILFSVKRGIFAGCTRKKTKKRNQNGKQYVYTGKVITY